MIGGETSRFSQCTNFGMNLVGQPLEPPFVLKDDEFEMMQQKEMDHKKKVIAGQILPNYKHNGDTEVKMQMVLLSELYGIKKPLVEKP